MEPDKKLTSYKRRKDILDIIGDGGLGNYTDVNLIEGYARAFSLDPDWVYENVSFDTIMLFQIKWKQEHEHKERYDDIERMMSESKAK